MTFWGWKGLTTKSLAPDLRASAMRACCPMLLHMTTLAAGLAATICLRASMPSLARGVGGITMSMSMRSGLAFCDWFMASSPFAASAMTSCPDCRMIFLRTARMKEASSTTMTVPMCFPLYVLFLRSDSEYKSIVYCDTLLDFCLLGSERKCRLTILRGRVFV